MSRNEGARERLAQVIAEAREFADRNNGLNWQGMVRDLADALEAATRERDAALARIAEAAKLHHKGYTALGHPICNTCGTPNPCPTRRRLGLNEGDN